MDEVPSAKDLRGAGAVAQTLAYVVGLSGVVTGGILLQRDEMIFAIATWVLTFALGAVMMIASFLVRALAGLMARIAHIESDVSVLVGRDARERQPRQVDDHDPWLRH